MTLVQILLKKGIINKDQAASLDLEIKGSGKKEEEVILEKGIVTEGFLFGLKSENLKIPLKEAIPEEIPLEVLETIPEDAATYYKMIPLAKRENILEVGMVYPEDIRAQEALKFLARQEKFDYQISLITLTNFNNLLKQYRTLKREVRKALGELEAELRGEKMEILPKEAAELERLVEEAPITKVVAVLLRHAVEGNASDIHIEPIREKLRVRFRIDGVLYSSIFLPKKVHPAVVARIKILSNLKIDETRIPQDGRFSTKIGERDIDFRVSTFPTTLGEKVAIRVLDPKEGLKNFDQLGLERRNFEVTKRAIEKPYGLILVTGPTGSGKTTTLYALLNLLNKEGVNIVTVEDPVEYFIEGINQSQVKPEIGYDFAPALRCILRQDPDIVMVGEIRDEETASLVIHATLTGHIVLSTLHTNNAIGVIPRLIDLGVQPFLIPPTLSVAISQRLVRRLCPYCKEKKKPSKEIEELILKEIEALPPQIKKDLKTPKQISIYGAPGCKKCNFKGYLGRIAVFEVLEMTDQLAEIVHKEPSELKIREEAFRQGMLTMKQDGILKVLDGVTSIEEVLRVAEEK
jgi:type IV pilus assembly protein PilB